ncbi:uncharacterized protein si:ch211-1a19.3 [Corythoichthys intestinalis]|uniref:uncharacterized protein si:ch211-1a19.3 n=1 Tax=Corythoichthys intestinalis TaxID=161448 RepID=UPI0025A62ED6|nr:uncharacterized protein si:ch211-1a19.3 [Corythoichthys intestinalis]
MTAAASQSTKMGVGTKVALALLSLWSLVSLVVIVTWSTSPDLQSSARCRQELRDSREKTLGAQALWAQDKDELEERLRRANERHAREEAALDLLARSLEHANLTLDECQQRQTVLLANISTLQEEAELQRQAHLNLTDRLQGLESHAEALQHNLTQSGHQAAVCSSLKAAADNHAAAAQTQTRACEANLDFLRKQLVKCQDAESVAPPPPQTQSEQPSESGSRSAAPSAVALVVVLCAGLLAS